MILLISGCVILAVHITFRLKECIMLQEGLMQVKMNLFFLFREMATNGQIQH
jgi:hypothetical protein